MTKATNAMKLANIVRLASGVSIGALVAGEAVAQYVPSPYIYNSVLSGIAGSNGKNQDWSCAQSPGSGGYGLSGAVIFAGSSASSTSGSGMYASSTGGAGGKGGNGYCSSGRGGGAGGPGGYVAVTYGTSGGASTMNIPGTGIVALSTGGVGGNGGSSEFSGGGTGGVGGAGGVVTVTNYGVISTSHSSAAGTFAISTGGAGGAGGYSDFQSGGYGGSAGAGGEVYVTNSNSITTAGWDSTAIRAVSIAGSAGSPGNSAYWGGGAPPYGAGNHGGPISVTNTGAVSTYDANAVNALSVGIWGSGGSVAISNAGGVTARGTGYTALLAISIGPDGGDYGTSPIAVLGTNANPGDGGAVSVWNSANVQGVGRSLMGLVAASVGGGGGLGAFGAGYTRVGSTSALTNNGGAVSVSNTAMVCSGGDCGAESVSGGAGRAAAIVALSVGGGGGIAGYGIYAAAYNGTTAGSLAGGGYGGNVLLTTPGGAWTRENNSPAKSAGSVGGGGGLMMGAMTVTASSAWPTITMGAQGAGGSAGNVGMNCDPTAAVYAASSSACGGVTQRLTATAGYTITSGASSPVAIAFSVGGGGGLGAFGATIVDAVDTSHQKMLGGAGSIGLGGAVYAGQYGGSLTSYGSNSPALVGLSVGSGGGFLGETLSSSRTSGSVYTAALGLTLGNNGASGAGNVAAVTDSASPISTQGLQSHGVVGLSVGAGGGLLGLDASSVNLNNLVPSLRVGGSGAGGSGRVDVANASSVTISGANSYGLLGGSVAGGGGLGGYVIGANGRLDATTLLAVGGTGGSGTTAGAVSMTNSGAVSVTGIGGGGLLAFSVAGGGGAGGAVITQDVALQGDFKSSVGGASSAANTSDAVSISNDGTVSTAANAGAARSTPAILAMSVAGGGGRGGLVVLGAVRGSGTLTDEVGGTTSAGGTSGMVTALNQSNASVVSSGDLSPGVAALSVPGAGGFGGVTVGGAVESSAAINVKIGAGSGGGGTSGGAALTNAGAVSTSGVGSMGLLAQSLGAAGGYGGMTLASASDGGVASVNVMLGGAGGASGRAGAANLSGTSGWKVSTAAALSPGALAQSIGGSGGVGVMGFGSRTPNLRPTLTLGGSGAANSTAGSATISAQGSTTTSGMLSAGLLAQSIGGNGGFAGLALNVGQSVSAPTGTINLGGDTSASEAAAAASVALGGGGSVSTSGAGSDGVVAQSIGGGGGFGGYGFAGTSTASTNTTSNFLDAYLRAQGGGGGLGAAATATIAGNVTTRGPASAGVVAQSVGDGGGSALVATNEISLGYNFSGFYLGGSSASALGSAGAVTMSVNDGDASKAITTSGLHAQAVLAQSVGAGGGRAIVTHAQLNAGAAIGGDFELGASGGDVGGAGGVVNVTSQGQVTTNGADSGAVLAQSIGGGGGYAAHSLVVTNARSSATQPSNQQTTAGSGSAATASASSGYSATNPLASETLQSSSGTGAVAGMQLGGNAFQVSGGGATTVTSRSAINTAGDMSDGVVAQSIGGGGGRAVFVDQNSSAFFLAGSATLGGGGSGGSGAAVIVTTSGPITMLGDGAQGVLAQSIGGGGGDARFLQTSAVNGGTSALSIQHAMIVGASAVAGGAVTVSNSAVIALGGAASNGVLAQSVGGGGGFSSSVESNDAAYAWTRSLALSTSSAQAGVLANASVTSSANNAASGAEGGLTMGGQTSVSGGNALALVLGSAVGSSATSAAVSVTNTAAIGRVDGSPAGDASAAILAQSVAGGGGASLHYARNMDEQQSRLALTLGGSGSAAGAAGAVTVISNSGSTTNVLGASGSGAMGLVAQSVAGGGGVAVSSRTTTLAGGSLSAAMTLGGSRSVGGASGDVNVTSGGSIVTGASGPGILAQSLSGGGGVAKVISTAAENGTAYGSAAGAVSAMQGATSASASSGVAVAMSLGGWSDQAFRAGAVIVDSTSSISTWGLRSIGVVAQSLTGGGGLADVIATGANGGHFAGVIALGGKVFSPTASDVKVTSTGAISTNGALSHGVVAQSIDLGGGVAGVATTGAASAGAATLTAQLGSASTVSPTTSPQSGKTSVTLSGSISTIGEGSSGAIAQSISGGGGLVDTSLRAGSSSTFTQTATFGGSAPGIGGEVDLTTNPTGATISTNGFFSHGLVAQSVGQGGGLSMTRVARGAGETSFSVTVSTATSTGGSVDPDADPAKRGPVSVTNNAAITTAGDVSVGVLAQSVTSGGAFGTSLKTVSAATGSATFTIGGVANTRAIADSATVENHASVNTAGAYALGLVAQSVAQGGFYGLVGESGSLVSASSLTATMGASGATSANFVKVTNTGAITTSGAGAIGVLAQAIGGGGGAMLHNQGATTVTATLGSQANSASTSLWTTSQANQASVTTSSISTSGDFAVGVVAQAIGGGGGLVGWQGAPAGLAALGSRAATDQTVGAGRGATTNVTVSGAISTGGYGAIGVLAQSIGAGGGAALGQTRTASLGSAPITAASTGDAAGVTVNVNAAITTSGAGAIGVLAQSIGGGGGVAFASQGGSLGPSSAIDQYGASTPYANGAAVTVNVTAGITTNGAGAAGVIAQSLGGGGGLILNPTGSFASPVTATAGRGNGMGVTVSVNGATVQANGAHAYGVVGQSHGGGGGLVLTQAGFEAVSAGAAGSTANVNISVTNRGRIQAADYGSNAYYAYGSEITIDATSAVIGGTGPGAAGVFAGASAHSVHNAGYFGSIDPLNGHAVISLGGDTTVTNSGIMKGAISLAAGTNVVSNLASGEFWMGARVDLGGGSLSNDGLLSATAPVTRLLANVTQSSTGRIRVLSDLAGGLVTQLQIVGAARLEGQVTPYFQNGGALRSGSYVSPHVLSATNGLTLGAGFSMGRTAIMTPTPRATANGLAFDTQVNFTPQGLSPMGVALGRMIDHVQAQGSNPLFRPVVDQLVNVANVGDLDRAYATLTSNGVAAAQQTALDAARRATEAFADRADLWRKGGAPEQGLRLWASPSASYGSAQRNGVSFSARGFGGVAGVDMDVATNVMLGFGAAVGQSRFAYGERSPGHQDFGGAALYGAWKSAGWHASAVGYAGAMRADLTRAFGPMASFADARVSLDGRLIAGRFEIGRSFALQGVAVTPFAAIQPALLRQNAATESATINATGAVLPGVTYLAQDARSLPSFLGLQFGWRRDQAGGGVLSTDLRLAWRHEFLDTRNVRQEFAAAPGLGFTRETSVAAKDALDMKLRVDWATPSGLRLFGELGASLAGKAHGVSARGGLQVAW